MVFILSEIEMPQELKIWLVLILLVILLLVGVVLALVLGRMLGPRGHWARVDRELAAKMREPSSAPDAWEESGKRVRVEDEEDEDWDGDEPYDEENDDGDRGYRY